MAQELARLASDFQEQRTGHLPTAVTVVLSEDTLVVTLLDALTPAEKVLSRSRDGAAQVQDFHRQLFENSYDEMRDEIKRITGRQVREAAAEVETRTGTVVLAFATGEMVQVYLLTPGVQSAANSDSAECADGEGLRVTPDAIFQDESAPQQVSKIG